MLCYIVLEISRRYPSTWSFSCLDRSVAFAEVLSCFVTLIVLLHCRSVAFAEVLSCLVTLIVLLHCRSVASTSSWPWTGGVGQNWQRSWRLNVGFGRLWTPSWPWNGSFGHFWTSSWPWTGSFGHLWTSSWPWTCSFRRQVNFGHPSEKLKGRNRSFQFLDDPRSPVNFFV